MTRSGRVVFDAALWRRVAVVGFMLLGPAVYLANPLRFWAFDERGRLVDVRVRKMIDGP